MNKLITVQEAFAARQAGKSIVCRHVESDSFEKLNNVSAETWFDPHYVFAIEIETITLGGKEFTRPYTLTELSANDEIYFCGASGKILKGKFNPDNEMLIAGVKNGSVQRDESNAIAQVAAFRTVLNIEVEEPFIIDYDFFVVDDEPKKLRGPRKKKEAEPKSIAPEDSEHEPLDESDLNVKKTIEAINSATDNSELDFIENELDESPIKRYVDDELNQFKDLIKQKREKLNQLSLLDPINTDLKNPVDQVENPTSSIDEYQILQREAENLIQYQSKLASLIDLVQKAMSIDEANDPVSQTLDWTVEQRLPLITAISKRLCELGKPLLAQIREASDLELLEAYLVQIREMVSVDGTLAHQCMQAYTVRKSQLIPSSPV